MARPTLKEWVLYSEGSSPQREIQRLIIETTLTRLIGRERKSMNRGPSARGRTAKNLQRTLTGQYIPKSSSIKIIEAGALECLNVGNVNLIESLPFAFRRTSMLSIFNVCCNEEEKENSLARRQA